MFKKSKITAAVLGMAVTFFSCEQEGVQTEGNFDSLKSGIYEMGYNPITDIQVDGDYVFLDDAAYTIGQVEQMIQDHRELQGKPRTEQATVRKQHWMDTKKGTIVSVGGNKKRFINIYTQGVTGSYMNALKTVINEYNNISGLDFKLGLTDKSSNFDIKVTNIAVPGSSLGRAQFPLEGNPGRWVEIDQKKVDANSKLNFNFKVRLVFHEIGHTLGLRHTDWATRESCTIGNVKQEKEPWNVDGWMNEGKRGSGYAQVPGTTKGTGKNFQEFSVMNACPNYFFDNAKGRFTFTVDDRKALQFMYPVSKN